MSKNDQEKPAADNTDNSKDSVNKDTGNDIDNPKKISNPLTIIGVFASLAEVGGTVVTALVPSLQSIYIWFVIGFPTLLLILFFLTLNFNNLKLYAPSDYRNDMAFLASTMLAENFNNDVWEKVKELEGSIDKAESQAKENTRTPGLVKAEADLNVIDVRNKLEATKESLKRFNDISANIKMNRKSPDKLITYLVDKSYNNLSG